jgi:hypothetical protein
MDTAIDDLRYPIGRFVVVPATPDLRRAAIADIASLPQKIRAAVANLTDGQLDTRYRPDGWTVRQLVHHVADSHMNGFARVKLALTEDRPTIKPYDENAWSTLADMRLPIEISLDILDGVHRRWTEVYAGMSPGDYAKTFVHPEHGKIFTLDDHLQNYSWHSRHHVAHITALRTREGW